MLLATRKNRGEIRNTENNAQLPMHNVTQTQQKLSNLILLGLRHVGGNENTRETKITFCADDGDSIRQTLIRNAFVQFLIACLIWCCTAAYLSQFWVIELNIPRELLQVASIFRSVDMSQKTALAILAVGDSLVSFVVRDTFFVRCHFRWLFCSSVFLTLVFVTACQRRPKAT